MSTLDGNNGDGSALPSGDVTTERSFTVLYYKRKNKVHKGKGVSKMDAKLHVLPPPKSVLTLKADGKNVYRIVNKELSKRDFNVDDQIALGHYDVEIVCQDAITSPASTGTATPSQPRIGNNGKMAIQSRGLLRSRTNINRPAQPLKRSPLNAQNSFRPLKKAKPQTGNGKKGSVKGNNDGTSEESSDDDDVDDDDGEGGDDDTPSKLTKEPTTKQIYVPPKLLSRNSRVPSRGLTKGTASRLHPRKTVPKPTNQGTKRPATPPCYFPGTVGNPNVPNTIKTALRPHQVEGFTFLWNLLTGNVKAISISPHISDPDIPCRGAILADEMGLGKTLTTIAIICAMHKQRRDMRYVVVCPSSLVVNWAKEFDKWIGKASQPKRVVVRKGGEEGTQQIKAFCTVKPNLSETIIISYDLFRMHGSLFKECEKVGLLVVDEGHRLKNTAGSMTLTALQSLNCDARLCITATPIQNILSDFYTIADFVSPGLFGDLTTFRREYERPISTSNRKNCSPKEKRLGKQKSQELDRIVQGFVLRRRQKEILKPLLPRRDEVLLFCRPTEQQQTLYRETSRDPMAKLGKGPTADALSALIRLRKLCSHPSLLLESPNPTPSEEWAVSSSSKLTVLSALLAQTRQVAKDDKVVVVSCFTSTLSVIENLILKPRGYTYVRLDGTTELSSRQSVVDTFNKTSSARSFVFLLSSKAGGCGLNLIGANRLVMFDPDWNPAADTQAMARVYRQGQKKKCTIYRLFTSGTVEEVIYQRQLQKNRLSTMTIDSATAAPNGSSGGGGGFTKEELRDCFTLADCDCDTKNKVGDSWPDYDGPLSIAVQGCSDEALCSVAEDSSVPLSFVHVVEEEDENETKDENNQEESQAAGEPSSGDEVLHEKESSSEEEFEL